MSKKHNANEIPYNSLNFQKILDFYLFGCPVIIRKKKVSQRGETFEKMNVTGTKLTSLLKDMKRNTEYHCVHSEQSVEKIFETINSNSSFSDDYFNLIVFIENMEIGKTKTIFYYIRNAFAHGDFSVECVEGKYIYTLRSQKNGKIKGMFRIKETTLLSWIDLVYQQTKPNKKSMHKNKPKKFKKAG